MKIKAYIAGKVTGRKINEVTMQFGAAEVKLRDKGYEVVNPLAVINDWHCPWPLAMKKCIAALVQCDAIFMLPGWEGSKGAILEHHIAQTIGIKITYL